METTTAQHKSFNYIAKVFSIIIVFLWIYLPSTAYSQTGSLIPGTAGYIRIESQFQVADTVFIWGDVISGTYLVPQGTTLLELISYAGWVGGGARFSNFNSDAQYRWVKRRAEIIVNPANKFLSPTLYTLNFDKPLDEQIRNVKINNYDVVSVNIRRRANVRDYFAVYGPIFSFGVTVILLVRNWN